mmetsp:Transcript_18670/g.46885  ORF Transcript_18670/g.46885 Transcript_18670/m.46885 type:complete len:318 (+) Transcript_18670:129-1082(+)
MFPAEWLRILAGVAERVLVEDHVPVAESAILRVEAPPRLVRIVLHAIELASHVLRNFLALLKLKLSSSQRALIHTGVGDDVVLGRPTGHVLVVVALGGVGGPFDWIMRLVMFVRVVERLARLLDVFHHEVDLPPLVRRVGEPPCHLRRALLALPPLRGDACRCRLPILADAPLPKLGPIKEVLHLLALVDWSPVQLVESQIELAHFRSLGSLCTFHADLQRAGLRQNLDVVFLRPIAPDKGVPLLALLGAADDVHGMRGDACVRLLPVLANAPLFVPGVEEHELAVGVLVVGESPLHQREDTHPQRLNGFRTSHLQY